MLGSIGGPELLLILVIALIVFGPRKLPEMGKSLGKMLVEFRRASNEFKRTIEDEVEAEKVREQVQQAVALPAIVPEHSPTAPPPEDGPAQSGQAEGEPVLPAAPAGTVPTGDASGVSH